MLHFRQTHGIRLGLSELVGGSPRTMADLIAVLSTLPVTPTRIILSKIQILMANEDSSDFENHMRTSTHHRHVHAQNAGMIVLISDYLI